jgi:hypothetical protein
VLLPVFAFLTRLLLLWEQCFIDFLFLHFWHDFCCLESSESMSLITMSLPEEQPSYEEPLSPVGTTQSGLAASFVTPSQKKNDGNWKQFVDDEPFIDERKPTSMMVAKDVSNNGEHTLVPITAKMIHSAVWDLERFVLKDSRPLHVVKLVGAIRNFRGDNKHVQIDV